MRYLEYLAPSYGLLFGGGLGGTDLLEQVCPWGKGFQSTQFLHTSCSLLALCCGKGMVTQFPAPTATLPCFPNGFYPSGTISSISSNKLFY
ncbi:hypothetical protein I79_024015 [Cricetulus griseus]|uniref:Uncharacterized protein n=1 Tax=Cricetulus griseus TaxID=10029 RepID=G3IJI0_CRIGR|nr:hypothetical protein I79_024015 [Cricetulus griseus]